MKKGFRESLRQQGDSSVSDQEKKEIILFEDIVYKSPEIAGFFQEQQITSHPQRVESRWRPINEVFIVNTANGPYVLKKINQPSWEVEIDYQKKLSEVYKGFVPKIVAQNGNTVVMEYAGGKDILTLTREESCSDILPLIKKAGVSLFEVYQHAARHENPSNGHNQLEYSGRYAKKQYEQFKTDLEKALEQWETPLAIYDAQDIHNDLNSANLRIAPDGSVWGIDTRSDEHNLHDVAKDLGRAWSGLINAAWDNGYSAEQCIALGDALSDPWEHINSGLPQRTAFYIGQSHLSFSRWDTPNLAKEGMFDLGLRVLQTKPQEYSTLNEMTRRVVEGYKTDVYTKQERERRNQGSQLV